MKVKEHKLIFIAFVDRMRGASCRSSIWHRLVTVHFKNFLASYFYFLQSKFICKLRTIKIQFTAGLMTASRKSFKKIQSRDFIVDCLHQSHRFPCWMQSCLGFMEMFNVELPTQIHSLHIFVLVQQPDWARQWFAVQWSWLKADCNYKTTFQAP